MRNYQEYIQRKQKTLGLMFDPSELAPQFIPFYENEKRIEVKFLDGEVKRGRVGTTTGWKPIFLLLLTQRSMGSCYTLHQDDKILKVIK